MLHLLHIRLLQLIDHLRRDERGAALVEYGMLVALIAVVCLLAVTNLGKEVNNVFTNIGAALINL
jgi:pilus assembly protein Flp/PilA